MLGHAPRSRWRWRGRSTSCPPGTPIVVDPVMVAESGARLLAPDAQRALVREILPRASVLTPNLPEARALVGAQPASSGRRGRRSRGLGAGGAGARPARGRAHGRPSRARGRPLPGLRWRRVRCEHRRRAPPRRCRTRLRLHPLRGPRRPAGPRPLAAGRRAHRPCPGWSGGRGRAARPRRREPVRST